VRYPGAVHSSDVVASALVLGSCAAFAWGSSALARAEDLTSLYWLAVGFLAVRAALSVVHARTE
jgi:hypothetical protein